MPKVVLYKQNKKKKNKRINAIIITIVVVLIGVNAFYYIRYRMLSEQLITLEKSLSNYEDILTQDEEVQSESEKIEKYLDKVDGLTVEDEKKSSEVIEDFQDTLPRDLVISSYTFENNIINISGIGKDYDSIIEFWGNVETSNKYEKITVPSIAKNSNNKYSFTAEIELRRGE